MAASHENGYPQSSEAHRTPYELALIEKAKPMLLRLIEEYYMGSYGDMPQGKELGTNAQFSISQTHHKGVAVIARRYQPQSQLDDLIDRASALALGVGQDALEQPLAVGLTSQVIVSAPLRGKGLEKL